MKSRPVITLALGVVLASGAVYVVQQQMNGGREPVAAQPPFVTASTVVASSPLPFGSRIGREHIRETLWPADSLPEGAFKSVDELLGEEGAEPRIALRAIGEGELLTKANVSGFGGRATLSSVLPEGKRAYSIRVNDVTGVAGFLLPGDRVDVMLTRQGPNSQDPVTDLILQDIKVRGVDQIADEDRNKPTVVRTVTVEVAPEEAQKLALAMQVGTLSLALRNSVSVDKTQQRTVRVSDLVHSEAPGKPRAARPAVRVIRAGAVTVEDVRR